MNDTAKSATRAILIKPDGAKLLPVATLLEAALSAIEAGIHHREMRDVIHNIGLIVKQVACEKIVELNDPAEEEAMHVFEMADAMDRAAAGATADDGDTGPLRVAARALLDYMGLDQMDTAS